MDNLKRLESIIEVLDTKSTMQDFVKAFELAIEYLAQLKDENGQEREDLKKMVSDSIDKAVSRITSASQQEWTKIRADLATHSDGIDGEQGPKGDKGDKGDPGKDAVGIPGPKGDDGSPDTPDQVIEKINQSKLLISKERIDGLVDALGQMVHSAVGITTTIFFKNGTQVGRAKNINIIEGNNMTATVYQTGDQMNISLSSTGGGSSLTWVADEVPTDSGDHINFTVAHTPASGTYKLFRGGAKQQSGVDFTLTGAALVLTNALITGEVLLNDYGY